MKIKVTLFLFVCFFFALPVWAAPFVVSNAYNPPDVIPDGFSVKLDSATVFTDVPADILTGGAVKFKYDVGTVSAGSHTMQVKAYKVTPEWGRQESTISNFTFTRPASPSAPSGLILQP